MPYSDSVALLPASKHFPRLNPTDPEAHELFASGLQMMEVWRNELGRLSVALGSGQYHYHSVGDRVRAHHDQAGYTFGILTLVASSSPAGGVIGELPNRKLPVRVYK